MHWVGNIKLTKRFMYQQSFMLLVIIDTSQTQKKFNVEELSMIDCHIQMLIRYFLSNSAGV